jgi:hypothetical protein
MAFLSSGLIMVLAIASILVKEEQDLFCCFVVVIKVPNKKILI